MRVYTHKVVHQTVTLSQIATYLERRGWREAPSSNPNAVIYHGPLDIYGKPLIAILPAREDLTDAGRRVDDVVSMLSTLEKKQPTQLLREIKTGRASRVAATAVIG